MPDANDVLLGASIKRCRTKRNFSQDDLAKKVGLTYQQIQKYEKGASRVSFSMMMKISGALDIPLLYLIPDECLVMSQIESRKLLTQKDKEIALLKSVIREVNQITGRI